MPAIRRKIAALNDIRSKSMTQMTPTESTKTPLRRTLEDFGSPHLPNAYVQEAICVWVVTQMLDGLRKKLNDPTLSNNGSEAYDPSFELVSDFLDSGIPEDAAIHDVALFAICEWLHYEGMTGKVSYFGADLTGDDWKAEASLIAADYVDAVRTQPLLDVWRRHLARALVPLSIMQKEDLAARDEAAHRLAELRPFGYETYAWLTSRAQGRRFNQDSWKDLASVLRVAEQRDGSTSVAVAVRIVPTAFETSHTVHADMLKLYPLPDERGYTPRAKRAAGAALA